MDRRTFLKASGRLAGGAPFAPLLSRLFASSALAQAPASGYRAIICLNLFGGNDGNNMLVPIDSYYDEYAMGRGPLQLPRNSLLPLNGGTSSRLFGVHPSLSNVANLYNQGNAAFLANAGPLYEPVTPSSLASGAIRPYLLLDHQTQLAEWAAGSSISVGSTGWAGRVADLFAASASSLTLPTVVSTAGWSLLGRGINTDSISMSLTPPSASSMSALRTLSPVMNKLENGDPRNHLHDQISKLQTSFVEEAGTMNAAVQAGSTIKTQFPNSSIGQQLQLIAQMIAGRAAVGASRQVFFCQDANQYDTHTVQLGTHASNLAGIDAAIGAFVAAMVEIGMFENVALFTMSDFGRSKMANSGGGSDHAWGNHHFIIGGSVKGGQIYGTFPSLVMGGPDDAGTTGLWIPTSSSSQYAATLCRWLGVSGQDTATIFPELANFKAQALGFV